jgi:hypothetical protein
LNYILHNQENGRTLTYKSWVIQKELCVQALGNNNVLEYVDPSIVTTVHNGAGCS